MAVRVTARMTAKVGGRQIHPVYGTASLVEHVEQMCRLLLEPHLEPGEDGVGYRIDVTHREPVPVGAHLELTATVADVSPQRLVCEVVVRHNGRQVVRGTFEQRVVDVEEFRARVAAAT